MIRDFVKHSFLVEVFVDREGDPMVDFHALDVAGTQDVGVLSDENGSRIACVKVLGTETLTSKQLVPHMRSAELEPEFFGIDDDGKEIDD